MMNNEQQKQIRNALMMAALNCGHAIDSDCITLQCDPAKRGNALAQLSDRLLDAYLAAAGASAEPVEPLPVVEPQVSVDESAAFEVWAKAEGLIQESHGIRSTSSMCDVAQKAWKAGRAALAATPAQAQEPYSWVLENGSYLGMERGAVNPWKGSAGAFPLYRAPVQPAAVPDGWKLVPAVPTEAMMHAAQDVPAPRPYGAVYRAMLAAAPATPAAQGDATEARTLQIGAATHLAGEQIFNLATPYFLWTKDGAACDGWQHATAGVVGMPSLLSFARSLTDAITTKAAS